MEEEQERKNGLFEMMGDGVHKGGWREGGGWKRSRKVRMDYLRRWEMVFAREDGEAKR